MTIDNSVRYVSKNDQSRREQFPPISKERTSKPNTRKKNASNRKLSRYNVKLNKKNKKAI